MTTFPPNNSTYSRPVRHLSWHTSARDTADTPSARRAAAPTDDTAVSDPQGQIPNPFVFKMSQMNATQLDGGSVKVVDSTTFKVSTAIAVAEVTVEPGAMRELHVSLPFLPRSSVSPGARPRADSVHLGSGTRPRTNGRTTCKHPRMSCLDPR